MVATVHALIEHAIFALELVGALVIVISAAVALVLLVARVLQGDRHNWFAARTTLGRGLILGLEFLIGADVLSTIMAPSLQDLARLGVIIVLRVVLSLAIEHDLREMGQEAK